MNHGREYIAVMGTLGSGKTTAARVLARELGFDMYEETVGENAFLPRFYTDMRRWAFHSQVFFLMEKLRQMVSTKTVLKTTPVVQDTPLVQDVYSYAQAQHELGNMDDAEWALYQRIYTEYAQHLPTPDLIVFLDTSIPQIEKRIAERGRDFEQAIPTEYLELLDRLNRKWIAENTNIPVLTVNTDTLDIARDKSAQEQFAALVRNALPVER